MVKSYRYYFCVDHSLAPLYFRRISLKIWSKHKFTLYEMAWTDFRRIILICFWCDFRLICVYSSQVYLFLCSELGELVFLFDVLHFPFYRFFAIFFFFFVFLKPFNDFTTFLSFLQKFKIFPWIENMTLIFMSQFPGNDALRWVKLCGHLNCGSCLVISHSCALLRAAHHMFFVLCSSSLKVSFTGRC